MMRQKNGKNVNLKIKIKYRRRTGMKKIKLFKITHNQNEILIEKKQIELSDFILENFGQYISRNKISEMIKNNSKYKNIQIKLL